MPFLRYLGLLPFVRVTSDWWDHSGQYQRYTLSFKDRSVLWAQLQARRVDNRKDPLMTFMFFWPFRMHAVWHQTLAVVCFGKIFGLLGKRADANEISEENESLTKNEEIQENEGRKLWKKSSNGIFVKSYWLHFKSLLSITLNIDAPKSY